MTRLGLTAAQARLLGYIEVELAAGRLAPSYDQMAAHMGLRSKSGIHRLVTGLQERGRIARLPKRARSIALPPEPAPTRAPEPAKPQAPEHPHLGIPKPVAEQLVAYCDRRRLVVRDVLAAALMAYMEGHP